MRIELNSRYTDNKGHALGYIRPGLGSDAAPY